MGRINVILFGVMLFLSSASESRIIVPRSLPSDDASGNGEIPLSLNPLDRDKNANPGIWDPPVKDDDFEYDVGVNDPHRQPPDYDYTKPVDDNNDDNAGPGIKSAILLPGIDPSKIPVADDEENGDEDDKSRGEDSGEPFDGEDDSSYEPDEDSNRGNDHDTNKGDHDDEENHDTNKGDHDDDENHKVDHDDEENHDTNKVDQDDSKGDDDEDHDDNSIHKGGEGKGFGGDFDEKKSDGEDDHETYDPNHDKNHGNDDNHDEKHLPGEEGDEKEIIPGTHEEGIVPGIGVNKPDKDDDEDKDDDDDDVEEGKEEGNPLFDNPFFNLDQVKKYFSQLDRAVNHVFRQTLDEALLLNGTYANTTEEEVDINGTKYIVEKSVIQGADNNSVIYVEAMTSKGKLNGTEVLNITDIENFTKE